MLIKAPSPMLIAVGMYLPFHTTAAIFIGGVIMYVLNKIMDRRKMSAEEKEAATNKGILLSSGLIAGEALMALGIALWFIAYDRQWISFMLPKISENFWLGLIIFPITFFVLLYFPLKKMIKK